MNIMAFGYFWILDSYLYGYCSDSVHRDLGLKELIICGAHWRKHLHELEDAWNISQNVEI